MKIDTGKRGLNNDECFCGSERDIKNMLNTLSLDDNYRAIIDMGLYISRCYDGTKPIFNFKYVSCSPEIINKRHIGPNLWFSFYPIKTKEVTEEIREEFKHRVIPVIKQEILTCVKRNILIPFKSIIKVSIENKKLVVEREIL
ncbi:MAG: hypothetical protein K2L98_02350 [Bacilli bacterium]|nr:hypothetical protein [Bacilli bacterium]